jgi:hypothetical protein
VVESVIFLVIIGAFFLYATSNTKYYKRTEDVFGKEFAVKTFRIGKVCSYILVIAGFLRVLLHFLVGAGRTGR